MRGMAVLVVIAAGMLAMLALADRTSVVYPPTDGGSAAAPSLSARKALEIFNNETVAVCVVFGATATPTAPCRPIVPGGSMALDVGDSHPISVRKCDGATVASCMGDGGVTVTEIQ